MSNTPEEQPIENFFDIAEHSLVSTDQYQAVFLSNGQVYFCRLWVLRTLYVLKDVYYFQNTESDTTNDQGKDVPPVLVKLGNEPHGPEDQMNVPKGNNNVIFWENLRDDGAVVQAIRKYQTSLE